MKRMLALVTVVFGLGILAAQSDSHQGRQLSKEQMASIFGSGPGPVGC